MGSKIFVNFTKYEFDECMRRLLVELKPLKPEIEFPKILQPSIITNKNPPPEETKQVEIKQVESKPVISNPIKDWTEKDVSNWITEKGIHPTIANNLRKCNGSILFELFLIKEEAPSYFYKAVSSSTYGLVLIKEIAVFSRELKILIQQGKKN